MIDTYPALTPLLGSDEAHASLSGVSLNVRLRAKIGSKTTETFGGFLFTHRGYSGPSVLDISHLTARGENADHSRAVVDALPPRNGSRRLPPVALAKGGRSAILARAHPGTPRAIT